WWTDHRLIRPGNRHPEKLIYAYESNNTVQKMLWPKHWPMNDAFLLPVFLVSLRLFPAPIAGKKLYRYQPFFHLDLWRLLSFGSGKQYHALIGLDKDACETVD